MNLTIYIENSHVKSIRWYITFYTICCNETIVPYLHYSTPISVWLEVTTSLSEMDTCELLYPDIGKLPNYP